MSVDAAQIRNPDGSAPLVPLIPNGSKRRARDNVPQAANALLGTLVNVPFDFDGHDGDPSAGLAREAEVADVGTAVSQNVGHGSDEAGSVAMLHHKGAPCPADPYGHAVYGGDEHLPAADGATAHIDLGIVPAAKPHAHRIRVPSILRARLEGNGHALLARKLQGVAQAWVVRSHAKDSGSDGPVGAMPAIGLCE